MHSSSSTISPKLIAWALIGQAFWVPLLAIDLHDRWVAHQVAVTPPGQPLQPSPLARATPFSLNDLLGTGRRAQQLAARANQVFGSADGHTLNPSARGVGVLLSSAGSGAASLLDRPYSMSVETPPGPDRSSLSSTSVSVVAPSAPPLLPTLLGRAFSRSQLLGGAMGLADLQEGPMGPMALAERAQHSSSGDPLAPLPSFWREPMRQALLKLPGAPQQLGTARMVYVPSRSVSQPVEVPLALQSDGSVDILQSPANAAVLSEIDTWSRLQRPPASGSLVPAVVHLHPLTPSARTASSVVSSSSSASPTSSAQSRRAPQAAAVTAPAQQLPRELPSRSPASEQSSVRIPPPSEAPPATATVSPAEAPAASPAAPASSALPIPSRTETVSVSSTPAQGAAPAVAVPIAASGSDVPLTPASAAP